MRAGVGVGIGVGILLVTLARMELWEVMMAELVAAVGLRARRQEGILMNAVGPLVAVLAAVERVG